MPKQPYQPIACAEYDIYEIAIMQHRLLLLKWKSGSGRIEQETIKPVHLQIQDGAEYLIFKTSDELQQEVRLDEILQAKFTDSDQ